MEENYYIIKKVSENNYPNASEVRISDKVFEKKENVLTRKH